MVNTRISQAMLFADLACPIDGLPLAVADGGALRCATGHSFDRASAGYYNLLVVQHKASRDPGDSKAMVAARRRFLDTGAYAPIADRTIAMVRQAVASQAPGMRSRVVDAGCGEGYYLDACAKAVNTMACAGNVQLAGIDISKWAVHAAAKRNQSCFWAVASNRHLPFARGSIDLLLSMFGFPLWDAFSATQPLGGRVLLVDPAPDHLIEVRSIIYPAVKATAASSLDAAQRAGYLLECEQRLRFGFMLASPAGIADLLAMTPHGHRAPVAGRDALAKLDRLAVTGDVLFRLLRHKST